jgi:hypothetical protein
MSPWPNSSLPNSDGSSLKIPSPEPPSGLGSPVSCAPCLAPVPSVLPPLASLVVFPLAHLQHLFSPMEAPFARSLRFQLRSPPLVRDPLPLMAPPLPFGSSSAAYALPGPGPLPFALIPEEAAPFPLSGCGLELDFPAEVYPTPLACCPPSKPKQKPEKSSSDLFLPMLEDSWYSVGLSCDGSNHNIMPLFSNFLSKHEDQRKCSNSKVGKKSVREINGLFCSTNYDTRSGSVSRGRNKRRVFSDSS